MSQPTIRANAGIYELVWEAERVGVRIDRLHENSAGLRGEITVKTLLPGTSNHVHQAQFNLTSTTSRRTLAKHLEERNPETVDWVGIIEDASVLVLRAYREGEPVVAVSDIPARVGQRHRLDPLLIEGHPNLIFGDGGTGKSMLAQYMAVLISSGHHHNGLSPIPGRCLYLDWETSGVEFKERVDAIEAGMGETGFAEIQYRFCVQPLANDIETIQRIVAEKEIEYVTIDSMGPACGADPSDPQATIAYFTALRSLRVTTTTLDHIPKNAVTPSPYGSVYKKNLSRSVFEIRKDQEQGEDAMRLGLYHRKSNMGKLILPVGLAVDFTPETIAFSTCPVPDIPALAEGMSQKERIRGFLLHEVRPVNAKEIAEGLGIAQNATRTILNRFRGKDFTRVSDGPEPTWAVLGRDYK